MNPVLASVFLALCATGVLSAPLHRRGDSIAAVCRELDLKGNALTAICRGSSGGEKISAILLSQCVGNANGNLAV
jgi:hypothetical protein